MDKKRIDELYAKVKDKSQPTTQQELTIDQQIQILKTGISSLKKIITIVENPNA